MIAAIIYMVCSSSLLLFGIRDIKISSTDLGKGLITFLVALIGLNAALLSFAKDDITIGVFFAIGFVCALAGSVCSIVIAIKERKKL